MNTIGKILVILNFLFALVMATLVAMNYTTTTNWKNQEDKYRAELVVAHANNLAQAQSNSELSSLLQAAKAELEQRKVEIAVLQAENASIKTDADTKVKDAETRAKLADIRTEQSVTAQERLQKENGQLKLVVADREGRVVTLSSQLRDKTDLAMTLDRDLKFSQERSQNLLTRNQELEVTVANLQQGGDSKAQPVSRDLTALNPPARFVKGVVERVDGVDKSLVKVSLGSDHGLKVGNTLEVYRTNPNQYLGVMRIEDAQYHTSVGKMIRTPGLKMPEIREGDTVASGLDSRR
jgi:hypothetical protein